jgi:Family of unknown function (DUF6210)
VVDGADSGRRVVILDPDGTLTDWMFVIVQRDAGVWYEHQYGGTATRQGLVQGYLIPVSSAEARQLLDELFLRDLKGTGLWGGSRTAAPELVERVRKAVGPVSCWRSGAGWEALRLDEARLADIDEGWVPVISADGPALLVWPNSD